jgi:asparagine synthase (glutamine-hydrolysing)
VFATFLSGSSVASEPNIDALSKRLRNGNHGVAVDVCDTQTGVALQRGEGAQIFHCPNSDYKLCLWGRVDTLNDLRIQLSLPTNVAMSEVLMIAWHTFGNQFAKKLTGPFAICIFNFKTQHMVLVRDALGMRPLYFALQGGRAMAANAIPVFFKFPDCTFTKNIYWVQRFLLRGSLANGANDCPYDGIEMVPPGHLIDINGGTETTRESFVQWYDNPPKSKQLDPKYITRHRELLDEAVARGVYDTGPVAVENSGGLDSTTILGILGKNHTNPLFTISTIHAALEPKFIELSNKQAGVKKAFFGKSSDFNFWEITPQDIDTIGYPTEQGFEVEYSLLRQLREASQSDVLFSGFGGDQVVTNNGTAHMISLIKNRQFKELWHVQRGGFITKTLRFLKRIASSYAPNRKQRFYAQVMKSALDNSILLLDEATKSSLALEMHHMYTATDGHTGLNNSIINHHLIDLHVQNRFAAHTLVADSFGLRLEWPLWDHALIQNYLSTPNIEKLGRGGKFRFLHRRAVRDVVPEIILETNTKDMGYPKASIQEQDVERIKYSKIFVQLYKTLHPDLRAIVDLEKFKKQHNTHIQRAGNIFDLADDIFTDTVFNLYVLDAWFNRDI